VADFAPITSLNGLVQAALDHVGSGPLPKVAIARSAEGFVLRAGVEAYERGVAEPVLIGYMDDSAHRG